MATDSTRQRHRREILRRAWRPVEVQLLFVGESPPFSGRFFYQRDSGLDPWVGAGRLLLFSRWTVTLRACHPN